MSEIISLINAAKYYQGLSTQKQAFDYLASILTNEELTEFARLYRSTPPNTLPKDRLKLLSQWDNKGDLNKDGRADALQTCNVTCVAMVINAYNNSQVTPAEIDKLIVNKAGSRYSHANLVWALDQYGLKSMFSTSFTTQRVINHLAKGDLVIWSNKLTHGGHIVVLSDCDESKRSFQIFDPYGEPMINGHGLQYDFFNKKGSVYWLSVEAFNRFSMNGSNSSGQWAHLVSKK